MASTHQENKVHFSMEGEGPPIILIHGIAASAFGWSRLGPTLVRNGYRIYAPDLPGHGKSHKPEKIEHYHIQEIYLSLVNWIDSLNLNQKFVLVGHSLGGHLSLRYSLDYPSRLSGMVLIDPFYNPGQLYPLIRWLQRKATIGTAVLRRTSEPLLPRISRWGPVLSSKDNYRRQVFFDMQRASPMILHILPTVPDLTPVLSDIQTTTQVIWGGRDRTLKAASFPLLVENLPNATGYSVAGAGHQPHLTRPAIVSPLILSFINKLTNQGS